MTARYNLSLIRKKRSYTVKKTAAIWNITEHTVRQWIKNGLPVFEGRPKLIYGQNLYNWLSTRQEKQKRKCNDGEMRCTTCCIPKRLQVGSFYFEDSNTLKLTAKGKCADCGTVLTRFDVQANREKLIQLFGYAQ